MSISSVKNNTIDKDTIVSAQIPNPPKITSYSVDGLDDTALDTAGGQTVLINGSNFQRGATVTLNGTQVSVVAWVSSSQLSFTSPANSAGTYQIYVVNTDGGTAIYLPGIIYSTFPTWTTAQGTLGSYYETTSISETVEATGDAPVTYSLYSGSLPTGATLASDGTITGTSPADSGSTTYSFVVKADDAQLQSSTRSFSITINTDVVTWVTPSSGATVQLDGTAYTQALSATDAAGYSVSYTANALPTGLTLSTGTISGTPTTEGSTTTLLTATSATTGRSAENTITWVVSLNDIYWKYNTILLSANSSIETQSFVADNSINNSQLTVVGDTRATNFNPYQLGYYSFYAPTNGDYYAYTDSTTFGTGDFTVEWWGYTSQSSTNWIVNGGAASNWQVVSYLDVIYWQENGGNLAGMAGAVPKNQWVHFAFSRTGGNLNIYINGIRTYSAANSYNYSATGSRIIGQGAGGTSGPVYMSNLRIIKGTGIYSGTTISVPTSPLLAVSGTSLLTCQNSRMIDNSPINYTITKTGSPTVSSAHPFTTAYQAGTQYYSSYFTSVTDSISIAANAAFTFGTGDFTIEFWMYSSSATAAIFDTRSTVSQTVPYIYMSTQTVRLYVTGGDRIVSSALSLNTWYHVAVSRVSGVTKMYLNGTATGTAYNDANNYASNTVNIGKPYNTAQATTGNISNLRVIKGQGLITANFTPSTSPLTISSVGHTGAGVAASITGTVSLLTCQNSTFKDNSTNNFTITSSGIAKPVAVSPFTPSSNTNTEITNFGSGYFDGTGDYLTGTNINFASNAFTIEGWFYPTTLDSGRNFWGMDNGASSNPKIIMYVDSSSRLTVDFGNAGTTQFPVAASLSTYGLTINKWNHIAVVRNDLTSTGFKLFINGVNAGQGQVGTNLNTITANFNIGYIGEAYGSPFVGYISDFRIVNGTALYTSNFDPQFTSPLTNVTNTQLLTLQTNGSHNNSVFKDSSSFNNLITRPSGANTTNGTFSPYGDNWSVYVDTGNPVMYTGNSTELAMGTSDFTFEAWINMTVVPNGSQAFYIFSNRYANGVSGDGPMACVTNSKLYARDGNSGYITGTTTLVANRWYHIAVVRSGTSIYCFIDGVQEGSTYTTSSSYTGNSIRVGYEAQFGVTNTAGYVSNLRVIKGTALYTPTLYPTGFVPSTTPLTAITNTKALLCNNNRHVDGSILNSTMTTSTSITVQKFSPFSAVTVPKYYSTYVPGSGDYLSIPNNAAFNFGTGDFTVECWVYHSSVGQIQSIVSNYTGSANGWGLQWRSDDSKLNFFMGDTRLVQYSFTPTVGTWYHYAVTRAGTSLKMFINGEVVATAIDSTNLTSSGATYIGNINNSYSQYVYGFISNLRLVKGSALYTSEFTPSTSTLTTTSQGATAIQVSLLTCQSNTNIDNSLNNFIISQLASSIKILPVSPFTPTVSTSTSYSPTVFGGSMYFDGTGDNLVVTTNASLNVSSGNFTLEWWMYPTNISASNQSLFFTGTSNLVVLMVSGTGVIQPGNYQTAGIVNPSTGVKQNAWTHVAITRSGNVWTVYYNGVFAANNTNYAFTPDTSTFTIGTGASPYYGYLSDYKLTKGAVLYTSNFYPGSTPLTPTTTIGTTTYSSSLLLNGTSGGVIDATRTVDLETVADSKVTNFSPYNGSYYSNYFDGTGDYLTVSTGTIAIGTGDLTLECWAYRTSTTTLQTIVNLNAYNTGILIRWESTKVTIYVGGTDYSYNTPTDIPLNAWVHIALVRTSGVFKFYVNGVQTTTFSSSYSLSITSVTIGTSSHDTSDEFYGYISNVRFISGTAIVPPVGGPTSPLTSISGTSLLTCQSNKFVDNSTNNFTITRNGDTKVATQNPFQVNTGLSYYFDGTGDYLQTASSVNTSFGTSDFTIEFWHFTIARTQLYPNLFSNQATATYATNKFAFYDRHNDNPTKYSLYVHNYSSSTPAIVSTFTPQNNQWYHVALTRTGSSYKLYINGNLDTTYTNAGTIDGGVAHPFSIGYSDATSTAYNGYISDFRITKGYARTISVPTTPYKLT